MALAPEHSHFIVAVNERLDAVTRRTLVKRWKRKRLTDEQRRTSAEYLLLKLAGQINRDRRGPTASNRISREELTHLLGRDCFVHDLEDAISELTIEHA